MEKVKLALNYALMLEMLKAKGFSNPTIVALLVEGNEEVMESIGQGIPSWKTLINYYHANRDKFYQALKYGYEISFLTKGSLKSLLSIKFGLKEGEDYVDAGVSLDSLKLENDELDQLREIIANNWTIILLEENPEEESSLIKIELTHKPNF